MRNVFLVCTLYSFLVGCGQAERIASTTKSLTKNSNQFSGKYYLKSLSIVSSGRAASGNVSKGECGFVVGDADVNGWRETAEDANCEIILEGIQPIPVLGTSKGALRISSDGEAVDGKLVASTFQNDDVTVEGGKTLFTSKKFFSSMTILKDEQRSTITLEYVLK